jgi:hypothetical protein
MKILKFVNEMPNWTLSKKMHNHLKGKWKQGQLTHTSKRQKTCDVGSMPFIRWKRKLKCHKKLLFLNYNNQFQEQKHLGLKQMT